MIDVKKIVNIRPALRVETARATFVTKGANALFWPSSEISEEAGNGWYYARASMALTEALMIKEPVSACAASGKLVNQVIYRLTFVQKEQSIFAVPMTN